MLTLGSPIEESPKVNRRLLPKLKRLGIDTVRDLLMYAPTRYNDFSHIVPIRDAELNQVVTIQGTVLSSGVRRTATRHLMFTEARIRDDSGTIKAMWFNQPYVARTLTPGLLVNVSGKVALARSGRYLQNPSYEKMSNAKGQVRDRAIHTAGLVAVYPETEGLTSRWLRYLIACHLPLRAQFRDPIPPDILSSYGLLDIKEAIRALHAPMSQEEAATAARRFSFEEMLLVQLRVMNERRRLARERALPVPCRLEVIKKFVASLPFVLTDAQRRSIWEIAKDMEKPTPMNRLLQGDVGSGKTVVAACSVLLSAQAGLESAVMAPTEILARQHFATIERLLAPFGVGVSLLTRTARAPNSAALVTIGTQALIQDSVKFLRLGLVIVDEQHRFGVDQRAALLKGKKSIPHFLSMTATPIPRTLCLTVYGDLDVSRLDQMPSNRKPVMTKIVSHPEREATYQFIREGILGGRQAFVVCPRIEEPSEDGSPQKIGPQRILFAEVKSVTREYEKLRKDIFPGIAIAMLHGKMKEKEKRETMEQFRRGAIQMLVSTSVIEVGVDVPNATLMIIEGAERFGLAQLHQFRGRVGRGMEQSYCFLLTTEDGMGQERLGALTQAKNGFELAEKDLHLRGPGDMLGTTQWGDTPLLARALADPTLVSGPRQAARDIFSKDPEQKKYVLLWERLAKWERRIHRE